jgi:hypothetical protein
MSLCDKDFQSRLLPPPSFAQTIAGLLLEALGRDLRD